MNNNNLTKKIEKAGEIINKNGITLIVNWVKGNMINYSSYGYDSQYFKSGYSVLNKYIDYLEGKGDAGYKEIELFCDNVIAGKNNIPVPFTICI